MAREGESPVQSLQLAVGVGAGRREDGVPKSRAALKCNLNMGGKSHPKLNISERPIVQKYREGKVK